MSVAPNESTVSPATVCLGFSVNTAVGEVAACSRRCVLLFHIIAGISLCYINVCKQVIIIIISNVCLSYYLIDRHVELEEEFITVF
jgi:hypothetical protein